MTDGRQPTLHVADRVEHTGFDPLPPEAENASKRRWWGSHVRELRWQAELARLLVDPIFRGAGAPPGDGSHVILIPGFLAGEESLGVLARWLRRIGYVPRRSGIRFNVDCSDRALDRLDERLELIHCQSGGPVTLLGHSRGGHFAKALATRDPARVARVVSLGAGLDTPFDLSLPTKAALAAVRSAQSRTTYRLARMGCMTDTCGCRFAREYAVPGQCPAHFDRLARRRRCLVGGVQGRLRALRRGDRKPCRAGLQPPRLSRDRRRARGGAASGSPSLTGRRRGGERRCRAARLGRRLLHLGRLLGDHRAVARGVDDAMLEPRVAPLEHPLRARVVVLVVVRPQCREELVDAAAGLLAEEVGELPRLLRPLRVLGGDGVRVHDGRGDREQLGADVDDPPEPRLLLLEADLETAHEVEDRAGELAR